MLGERLQGDADEMSLSQVVFKAMHLGPERTLKTMFLFSLSHIRH